MRFFHALLFIRVAKKKTKRLQSISRSMQLLDRILRSSFWATHHLPNCHVDHICLAIRVSDIATARDRVAIKGSFNNAEYMPDPTESRIPQYHVKRASRNLRAFHNDELINKERKKYNKVPRQGFVATFLSQVAKCEWKNRKIRYFFLIFFYNNNLSNNPSFN